MILLSRRVCSIMRLTRCIGISAACSVWRRQHGCSISTVSAHRPSGAARRSSGRRTMQGVLARERLCCTIHRLYAASRSRSSRSVRRRWTCWVQPLCLPLPVPPKPVSAQVPAARTPTSPGTARKITAGNNNPFIYLF